MHSTVAQPGESKEFSTPERCAILESWNDASDSAVSIARARVAPAATTQWHRLHGVVERYLIISGSGFAEVGDATAQASDATARAGDATAQVGGAIAQVGGTIAQDVGPGDVIVIPPEVRQRIRNTGSGDLVFYCICSPRFTQECYESLE